VGRDALGKSVESVAAFQHRDDPALAQFVRKLHDDARDRCITLRCDVELPEEVVAHPADDYVSDFTRDVPRAHVLTVRTIMRPQDGETDYAGDVAASIVIQDLLPRVVNEHRPYRVIEDGAQVGVVDRTAVLAAMVEA